MLMLSYDSALFVPMQGPCCIAGSFPLVRPRQTAILTKMIRTGTGFDAHRFVSGRPLVLGGSEVPHSEGLFGHSDADVLTHAICDALLGAVAAGDIGQHFPDSDPRWKDVVSINLLKEVAGILKDERAVVQNIDATIIAEKPVMAPHIPGMRQRVARALKIELGQVSIKATTVEGMGALGREEGIAAMAVATVEMH